MSTVPVVVFGYNRPEKFRKVLSALQFENVQHLILSIDGARTPGDDPGVAACRRMAGEVDWAETELDFAAHNAGVARLKDKINSVLERYPAAIFLEDDCVPVQGFYRLISSALDRYQDNAKVFSIGAYQHLSPRAFHEYPYTFVSGARFVGWGWATWRDRWQRAWPLIENYQELFDHLSSVPEVAGSDLGPAARRMAVGQGVDNWDVRVALAALALKQVHLLPVAGLVRTIGQDITGIHGSVSNILRARLLHNQNVAARAPARISWLEDVSVSCNYVDGIRDFVTRSRALSIGSSLRHGINRIKRSVKLQPERLERLDLAGAGAAGLQRRALLSYIVHPFSISEENPRFHRHINIWHACEMVKVLNQMGYAVDVVDYRDTAFSPRNRYDLFIGHGGVNFGIIAAGLPSETPKIYFSTGAYWRFHNQQEQDRFAAFQRRRGEVLPYDRGITHPEDDALRSADAVIGIGNAHTRQTYQEWENVWMIPGTAKFDDTFDWCPIDHTSGRNNFLFFASGGNIHKGLDLTLEAFDGLEQQLWVIAPINQEFRRVYRRELFALPNIHTLGYVTPRTTLYYRTLRKCSWCLLPSCSEGQAQSVIEAMNAGIVPIVSRAAGVDVEGFGEWIEPVTIETIRRNVVHAATTSLDDLAERSRRAQEIARTVYAQDAFRRNFREAIKNALSNK